ncbi:DNA cytosine methyltransferase [Mammaliicoccus fleurettii]|uniref:DNA cytosine methyltransferase n=1 Tax=Mammaliicoccus fleurettii TaxID=150056 RepID=UPI002DBB8D43|nr:DNA cytosine methyltransferase [Mammaliicoccus fleurettii]MEB7724079.1 DNA cytosine methyltransferase [Mammaliicoccus fleurettii]
MKKHKIISLFSGAGGMDLGFIQSGFKVLWANDFNLDATITYRNNIGDHITHGDVSKVDFVRDLPDEEIDVIIGGFPCQGFSVANTRRTMNDKRNFLYLELLRAIEVKKPKFFVAENVKGLLSMEKGKVIEMIVNDFEKLGYKVDYKVLNAADYGVPQSRERVFIIGNRMNMENPFPQQTHALKNLKTNLFDNVIENDLKPYVTTEEAIGFLSDVELVNGKTAEYIEVDGRIIYNHIASTKVSDKFFGRKYEVNQHEICDYLKKYRDNSEWTTKKIDKHFGYKHTAGHWFRKDNKSGSIPNPSDWWELKKLLKFDDKYDEQVTTFIEKDIKYEQSLRITNWDRASDTITATSPEIHVNRLRRLSARECAILQTFPDEFVFHGSLNSIYRQIGNAVPVELSKKIALEIKKCLY